MSRAEVPGVVADMWHAGGAAERRAVVAWLRGLAAEARAFAAEGVADDSAAAARVGRQRAAVYDDVATWVEHGEHARDGAA